MFWYFYKGLEPHFQRAHAGHSQDSGCNGGERPSYTIMMTYKAYGGPVRFDDESDIFHGEVTGLRDVVTFQGRTVDDLKAAFQDSIDDYLEFCASRGEESDKPFSGRFLLRVEPSLHRRLVELSSSEGECLNNWIASRLGDIAKPA